MSSIVHVALFLGLVLGAAPEDDPPSIKLSECPPAVRKTLQGEAKGAAIEAVTREKDDDGHSVYWADVPVGGKTYAIGVLEDGTLVEMNLAVDDDEVPFDKCPDAVKATFRVEAFGEKVATVDKEIKYGVPIYEAVVAHDGRSYEVVVAENGTLVEKVLIIDDEEVEIAACPAPVQAALREHAKGGKIGAEITRSSGIGKPTFEAEIEVGNKIYLIEVDESGLLISKSLEAGGE